MRSFKEGHALVIGAGDYADTSWNAPIARSEAQAVADALRDPEGAAYPPSQVQTLIGAEATHEAIIGALGQLAARADADATVLLYLCGHGEYTTDGGYAFAAHDTAFSEDERIVAGTGVSSHELLVLLREIRARKLVCIVNACFAGNLGPGFGGAGMPHPQGAPPSPSLRADILASGEGRVLLTAGRASQPSYYMFQQPYTLFGAALIEGLRGMGIHNNGGYIGLYALYHHIYTQVTTAAASIGRVQEPMLTILEGVGPYPLALHPGPRRNGAHLAYTDALRAHTGGVGAP